MSEENKRPTSFAEASSKVTLGAKKSLDEIAEWAEGYKDKLTAAAEAAQEESEDKGFWGKLASFATVAGCVLTGGNPLPCTAAATLVGGGTRVVVDWLGDAEDQVPDAAKAIQTRYYGDKAPEIAKELNKSRESLEDFHADEWKNDLMLQLSDSFTAYKIGSGMESVGLEGFFKGTDELADAGSTVTELLTDDPSEFSSILEDKTLGQLLRDHGLGVDGAGENLTIPSLQSQTLGEMLYQEDPLKFSSPYRNIVPDEDINKATIETFGMGGING